MHSSIKCKPRHSSQYLDRHTVHSVRLVSTEALRSYLKCRVKSLSTPNKENSQQTTIRKTGVEVDEVHNAFMASLETLEAKIDAFERSKALITVPDCI